MQGHYGKRLRAQSKLYAKFLELKLWFRELLENYLFHYRQKISSKKSGRNNLRVLAEKLQV